MLDSLSNDIRMGLRGLVRKPRFSIAAGLTLVVGITTITSILSLVDSFYFRALPYPNAERTVALSLQRRGQPSFFSAIPAQVATGLQRSLRAFDGVSTFRSRRVLGVAHDAPVSMSAVTVDSSFAQVVGIRPTIGRWFSAAEIGTGAPVVVVSQDLARALFGESIDAIGKSIALEGQPFTVVGVEPTGEAFPSGTGAWLPGDRRSAIARPFDNDEVIGHLASGYRLSDARAELKTISATLTSIDASYAGSELVARDEMLDRGTRGGRPVAIMLVLAAVFVLSITCVNVGNLMLIRAGERQGEFAVRAALGATTTRLVAHATIEGILLVVGAGVLSLLCSWAAIKIVLSTVSTIGVPSWVRFGLDSHVLLFALTVLAPACLMVAAFPARAGAQANLAAAATGTGRMITAANDVSRMARIGLVLQLACATTLSVGSVLTVQSYFRLVTADVGYNAGSIWVVPFEFGRSRYDSPATRTEFARLVGDRMRLSTSIGLTALRGEFRSMRDNVSDQRRQKDVASDRRIFADGDTSAPIARRVLAYPRVFVVSDSYFATVGLRAIRGRMFLRGDRIGSAIVALVSRHLASAVWLDADPVGKTLQIGAHGLPITVIGVVEDVRDLASGARGFSVEPRPDLYLSERQAASDDPQILARSGKAVGAVSTIAVDAAKSTDPGVAVDHVQTLADENQGSIRAVRLVGGLFTAFGFAAWALSAIGIYGVVAYSVSRRNREIGVRIALGCTALQAVGLVLRECIKFTAIGTMAGIVGAVWQIRFLRPFLFGGTSVNAPTIVAAVVAFFFAAVVACYLPASRAGLVDPVLALRAD